MAANIGDIVLYNHPGSADGKFPPKQSPAIVQKVNEDGSLEMVVFSTYGGLFFNHNVQEGFGPSSWQRTAPYPDAVPRASEDAPLMRAKFRVSDVTRLSIDSIRVTFDAVCRNDGYPPDGSDENNSYARWTPCAHLEMTIQNPSLLDSFTAGQEFYFDATLVKESR